jgi:hypothetical protein
MEKYDNYAIECDLVGSYRCLVNSLRKKYGPVPYDYFTNESCKSTNSKNNRAKDGLVIHHVDENKVAMLSDPETAAKEPFKYQKAEKLVYCNLLEHLILHYKIFEGKGAFGIGGALNYIIPAINDYYNGWKPDKGNLAKIYSVLDDNFDGYISILRDFYLEASMYPWIERRVNKERLSKGTNRKIVDKIYQKLCDTLV